MSNGTLAKLLSQKCGFDFQADLMDSMVLSNYQSLSIDAYQEKISLQSHLRNESKHTESKIKNCISCEHVLNCSYQTSCSSIKK